VKKTLSLTLTQQLQIANTMAGAWKSDNARFKSQCCVYAQERISLFSGGGSRGLYTQNGYNFLLTIPPAGIEPEHAFSSAGILCSKLRYRMTDAVLDNMLFLRTQAKTHRPFVNAT